MFSLRLLFVGYLALLVASSPEATWALAHELVEHHHADHQAGIAEVAETQASAHAQTHCAELAQWLEHGHLHPEGEPQHEHRVRLTPASQPRPGAGAGGPAASLAAGFARRGSTHEAGRRLARASKVPDRFGTGPPVRHLLCTLLI